MYYLGRLFVKSWSVKDQFRIFMRFWSLLVKICDWDWVRILM